jgi:hypothetical protein
MGCGSHGCRRCCSGRFDVDDEDDSPWSCHAVPPPQLYMTVAARAPASGALALAASILLCWPAPVKYDLLG